MIVPRILTFVAVLLVVGFLGGWLDEAIGGGDSSTWSAPAKPPKLQARLPFDPGPRNRVVLDIPSDPVAVPVISVPLLPEPEPPLKQSWNGTCDDARRMFAGREDIYEERCLRIDVFRTAEPSSRNTTSPQ